MCPMPDPLSPPTSIVKHVGRGALRLRRFKEAHPDPPIVPAPVAFPYSRERWRNFVRMRTQGGGGKSLRVLGEEWAALNEEEKNAFLPNDPLQRPRRGEIVNSPINPMPRRATPCHLGDDDRPVALRELREMAEGANTAYMCKHHKSISRYVGQM
jgi:hypothetical protein